MASLDSSDTTAITEALRVLSSRVTALQGEVGRLNDALADLGVTLARLSAPPTADLPDTAGPLASPSQWLVRRNAERLNSEVMRRSIGGIDPENDTEVDLMIDRLHALCDHEQGSK